MAIDIKNWVKKQTVGDRNAKVILLEIADCGNADGYCTYGISTIAATLEMSTRTVERGLAFLQEEDFISREESDKQSGKFTSKNTQILIPEDDWNDILYARDRRRVKQLQELQNSAPSVKLTDGFETVQPSDNLTDGQNDRRTDCQKPSDNLSVRQFVGLNDSNKNVITGTIIEELNTEESLFPHAPAREELEPENPEIENSENQNFPDREMFDDNRRSGIPVGKMMNFRKDPKFRIYTNKIVEGLKIRHGTPARLPNRDQWEAKIEDAWHNKFPAEQCLEAYDLIEKIFKLKHLFYPVTVKNWAENIPRINKLRLEVKELEKGAKPNNAGNGGKYGAAANKPTADSHLSDDDWELKNAHLVPDYGDDDD